MNAEMIAALRELEREKGIAFETILQGLEEAMASAYKTWWKQENPDRRRRLRRLPGRDRPRERRPAHVEAGARGDRGAARRGRRRAHPRDEGAGRGRGRGHRRLQGPHRRADREAGDLPEAPRRRARDDLRGVRRARGRRRHRHRAAAGAPLHAARPRQGRGAAARRPSRCRPSPTATASGSRRTSPRCARARRARRSSSAVRTRGCCKALFAMEVPEVEEGIVEIRAVAREPGHRSKIGVLSNEPGVDPVGACVGPKGSRVRMVVNELRGEKIDVVPWSENSAEFVANALQPAKVKEVRIDEATGHGDGDRARLPALARDRQGGPERPARGAAHRAGASTSSPRRRWRRKLGRRGTGARRRPSPQPEPAVRAPSRKRRRVQPPTPEATTAPSRAGDRRRGGVRGGVTAAARAGPHLRRVPRAGAEVDARAHRRDVRRRRPSIASAIGAGARGVRAPRPGVRRRRRGRGDRRALDRAACGRAVERAMKSGRLRLEIERMGAV